MDLMDRLIDFFFSTRALFIWTFIYGFLVAELALHGTRHPLPIAMAGVLFLIFLSVLVFDIGLRTGFWKAPRGASSSSSR
jgi:hypothetical protein